MSLLIQEIKQKVHILFYDWIFSKHKKNTSA